MQLDLFWKLEGLADAALLESLSRLVVSGRRSAAQVVAHLAEVEERRLHLDAGYSSMFAYCTSLLGFSEDEAYRRIEVARIGRRAPRVFELLASGELSLSVAALLKPYRMAEDLSELVTLVSGTSVQAARELLAARFPRPDVPSGIRRLPRREVAPRPALESAPPVSRFDAQAALADLQSASHTPAANTSAVHGPAANTSAVHGPAVRVPPVRRDVVDPLSEGRYRIQFTADLEFKHQLELAKDLMRHAVPSGDIAIILTRALDQLIEHLMKRRFAQREGARQPTSNRAPESNRTRTRTQRRVTAATRREVCERDGLRCTWESTDGRRCGARAWLERDHRRPVALGGDDSSGNVRHLCRAHNRRAAELAFGREHVERAIRGRGRGG